MYPILTSHGKRLPRQRNGESSGIIFKIIPSFSTRGIDPAALEAVEKRYQRFVECRQEIQTEIVNEVSLILFLSGSRFSAKLYDQCHTHRCNDSSLFDSVEPAEVSGRMR